MKLRISLSSIFLMIIYIFMLIINLTLLTVFPVQVRIHTLEFEILILLCFCFYSALRRYGILSELFFFLVSMFLFLCILPIENLLGLIDVSKGGIISYSFFMPEDIYIIALNCLIFALVSISVAICIFHYNEPGKQLITNHQTSKSRIASKLFYVLVVFSVPYRLYMGIIILSYGYGSIFNGVAVSSLLSLSSFASSFVFPSLILSAIFGDTEKGMKAKLIIYMLWSLIGIFEGRRTEVIVSFLFSIWFYNRYIGKVKLRTILILVFFVIFINIFMLNFRGDTFDVSLDSNGGTFYVLALTIQNEEILNSSQCNELGVPYSFGIIIKDISAIIYKILGVVSPFSDGQSISTLQHSNYLGWELTYLISPNSFLTGYGTGSCYVAEAYLSAGYLGIVFFTFFIMKLISIASKAKGAWKLGLYFVMIESLIAAPRNSFFNFFMSWVSIIIVYFFVKILNDFLSKKTIYKT